jgi:hypothetical protein
VAGELDLDRGFALRRVGWRGLAQHRLEAAVVVELGEPAVALALAGGDDVVQLALGDLGDVVVEGHAAVDHHGGALGRADARRQAVEHGRQRGAILGVAGEDFVGDREALAADHQADHDLLAVRAPVARVAALRLGIGGGEPFEIGRGEVVEEEGRLQVEQALLAAMERGLDGGAVGVQLVEGAVERLAVDRVEPGPQQIGERGAPDPSRHGVLGSRRDQPVEDHRTGEPLHRLGQSTVAQYGVEAEALPELHTNMHRPGLAVRFGGNAGRVDRDGGAGRGGRNSGCGGLVGADLVEDAGDWPVVRLAESALDELTLADQGVFDAVDQFEPCRARARTEVAKRADHLVAWSLGGADGFQQQVIGVGPPVDGLGHLAHEHGRYIARFGHPEQHGAAYQLVTTMVLLRIPPLKSLRFLTRMPTKHRPKRPSSGATCQSWARNRA